jgi:hypothetical protein
MRLNDLDYNPKINIAKSEGFFKILDEAGVGKIVQGVNTTVDVHPGEIPRQAAKMGNKTSNDGYPPVIKSTGKFKPIRIKKGGK